MSCFKLPTCRVVCSTVIDTYGQASKIQGQEGVMKTTEILICVDVFLIFYLFIFRKRGREGERQGEKH